MKSGLLGACVAVLLLVTGGGAAATTPVGFANTEAIETSCSALADHGVDVAIRNKTAVAQELHVGLALRDPNEHLIKPESICGGVEVEPGRKKVEPGESALVRLRAGKGIASDEASGSLAVYGSRGRVANRAIVIAPAETASQGAPEVKPLVTTVSVEMTDSDDGTIKVPVEGSNEEQAQGVKGESGTRAVTLGAISGPGGPVPVTYEGGSRPLSASSSELDLTLDGDLDPGTYTGQVILDPGADEPTPLALEVKAHSSWIYAAALLAVGIAFGLLLLRFAGSTLPRARLLGRVEGLSARYAKALTALKPGGAGVRSWNGFEIGDLAALETALRTQVEEETAGRRVLVKIEDAVRENLEKAIAVVEAQIDLVKEIPKHARGLEETVQLPRPGVPPFPTRAGDPPAPANPKLEIAAGKVLEGKPINAEDLKARLEAMDALAKEMRNVRRLESQLSTSWALLNGAETKHQGGYPGLKNRLSECWRELWEAEDAKQIEQVDEDVQGARADVRKVCEDVLDAATQSRIMGMMAQRESAVPTGTAILVSATAAPVVAGPPPPPIPTQPPPPVLTAEAARREIRRAWRVQAVVVVAAAFVAITSGLALLYVGKTWGTEWDWIAAVTWGMVTQATVGSLATSLDGLGLLSWLRRT